jgi:hypothetical protein
MKRDAPISGGRKLPAKVFLYWADLSNVQKSVLDAMLEHCSDGSVVWASLARIAAYAKVSRKTVQRVLRGDETSQHRKLKRKGLIELGYVTELAQANAAKRRPATYRINFDALADDPAMARYAKRPSVPVKALERESTADRRSIENAPPCGPMVHSPTDRRSSDSLNADSLQTKTSIQHANGAVTLSAWLAIKEALRAELSVEDWNLWVRPAMFQRADGRSMLIALPPNGRIQAAALAAKPLLNEFAERAGLQIRLTAYPDEWQKEQLEKRFGLK